MKIPILETKRLMLIPLEWGHQNEIYHMDRNPNVMRYIGRQGQPKNMDQVTAWIERRLPGNDGLGTWSAFLKKSKTFVGCYLLIRLEDSPHIEIGYRLMEDQWGKGYATEGSKAILNYAFRTLQLKEVVAVAIPENLPSRKVMTKLGLEYLNNTQYYQVEVAFYRITDDDFFAKEDHLY